MLNKYYCCFFVIFFMVVLPFNKSFAEDASNPEESGIALEMGYGSSFAGLGVGGEGMISLSENLHLSLIASYGYLVETSGYAVGGRVLYGSNHRLYLEYAYGLIGYEEGDVIEDGREKEVFEDVYGSSVSLGYQYVNRNGFLALGSVGYSLGEGEYEGSVDDLTFSVGIGYKF